MRPSAWTATRLKRTVAGPASGRFKVVFLLLACCMQEDVPVASPVQMARRV